MYLIITKLKFLHLFIQQSLRMNVVMSRSKEPTFVTFLSILPRRDKDRLDYAFERDDLF